MILNKLCKGQQFGFSSRKMTRFDVLAFLIFYQFIVFFKSAFHPGSLFFNINIYYLPLLLVRNLGLSPYLTLETMSRLITFNILLAF